MFSNRFALDLWKRFHPSVPAPFPSSWPRATAAEPLLLFGSILDLLRCDIDDQLAELDRVARAGKGLARHLRPAFMPELNSTACPGSRPKVVI